jgi:hypothetical protein
MTASVDERLKVFAEACRLAGKDAAFEPESHASWSGDHWECSWAWELDPDTVGEIDVCLSGSLEPRDDVAISLRITRRSGQNWSAIHAFAPLPAAADPAAVKHWGEYLAKALAQRRDALQDAWREKRTLPAQDGVAALRSLAKHRKTG